jgi:hypothetical protein
LALAKAEFDSMMRDGKARRAEGIWSSALHLMPMKDSIWRLVEITEPRSLAQSLADNQPHTYRTTPITSLGAPSFRKLTFVSADHQIPVYPDDTQKTAINVTFGLF